MKTEGWAKGTVPESWACIDCGINTAPGCLNRVEVEKGLNAAESVVSLDAGKVQQRVDDLSEVYAVKPAVWKVAGMEEQGGCLCIACLERRLGRTLTPKDFNRKHAFHQLPGTPRLLARRGDDPEAP